MKQLRSAVSRLRGRVGTDASKTAELADALVALTAARLRAREVGDAAADAQESLALAAKLLAANGPLGPYTPIEAAARLVTASVHYAVLETIASRLDSAKMTLASADAVVSALPALDINAMLSPELACWGLIVSARVQAHTGDVSLANATISAASKGVDLQEYERLTTLSHVRWLAGQDHDALAYAWQAVRVLGDCGGTGLAHTTLADLLVATGELEAAVAQRRAALQFDPQAANLKALADDLLALGRQDEAAELLSRPGVAQTPARTKLERHEPITWQELPPGTCYVQSASPADAPAPDVAAVIAQQRRAEQALAMQSEAQAARRSAAALEAARVEAERAAQERAEAELKAERARQLASEAEAVAIAESQRRREQRMAEHAIELSEQQKFDHLMARVENLRRQQASQELVEALGELSQALRDRGEWWAARKPAKEARQLAKKLGI